MNRIKSPHHGIGPHRQVADNEKAPAGIKHGFSGYYEFTN